MELTTKCFWATAITCIINMAQNKADFVLYKGAMSKGKGKAKAQVSVRRQSLEIHTVGNDRRPQLLEKMGRDSDHLTLWNRETCGFDFLKREEVKLYAEWGVQSWTDSWRRTGFMPVRSTTTRWRLAWPGEPSCL